MSNREVWIVSAVRTPIGSFLGGLSSLTAPELGAVAIRETVKRANVSPNEISEVYMGCVLTAAMGQAPARQAAIKAGLSNHTPCTTIGKVCGSGLKAVMLGTQAILSGDAEIVVAGGMESMSNAPYAMKGARQGFKLGHQELVDTMIRDGLWDVYNDFHMGVAAEKCAKENSITREAQDAHAKHSYEKALRAQKENLFEKEIVPVEVSDGKNTQLFSHDEEPSKAKFDRFATLKPVFDKQGSVTAANASSLNDGAAALVLMSDAEAKKRNLKPLAKISGQAQFAREPEYFTVAPVGAIQKLFDKLSWKSDSVDLFEINEAFSVVSLAISHKLGLKDERINVHGGAVGLGHPIGASGARVLVTLVHALEHYGKKRGVASLCIGGGEAVAVGVERV